MVWGMIPALGNTKGYTQDELIDKWLSRKTDDYILDLVCNMKESCTLDVAEQPTTLQEIGDIWGVSRERVRQMEETKSEKYGRGGAIKLLRASISPELGHLREFLQP